MLQSPKLCDSHYKKQWEFNFINKEDYNIACKTIGDFDGNVRFDYFGGTGTRNERH